MGLTILLFGVSISTTIFIDGKEMVGTVFQVGWLLCSVEKIYVGLSVSWEDHHIMYGNSGILFEYFNDDIYDIYNHL